MASPQEAQSATTSPRPWRGGRIRRTPETEFQAAQRARRERSRKRGPDAGDAGARRFDRRQGRGARHDRGDDRARSTRSSAAQMNEILHAPEFQQLESAWRGLNYLVFNSETDATLKIRVLNVGKMELYRNLRTISRRALGSEPAVQDDLRKRIRPVGRRALRRACRRLSLQPCADRRSAAARSLEDRLGFARAADHRRRSEPARHGFVARN